MKFGFDWPSGFRGEDVLLLVYFYLKFFNYADDDKWLAS